MKRLQTNVLSVSLCFTLLLLFQSCKKENVSSLSNRPFDSNQITDAGKPGLSYDKATGYYKLILQPGGSDGQDAWIEQSESNSDLANANSGSIDQFKVLA